MLPMNLHLQPSIRSVLPVLALAVLVPALAFTSSGTYAQSVVPDAPTGVAVYVYSTQTLEIRWSSSDAADTTSFKIQWKSGTDNYDSTRQLTVSDPATSKVALQSTSSVERYAITITGLTDDTEYTIRVIAANSNGDSGASDEVTGTPTDEPHLNTGDAGKFIEKEVVELFEISHSWLRETWDHMEYEGVQLRFHAGADGGGFTHLSCQDSNLSANQLNLSQAICSVWLVEIGRYDSDPIHTATHELAHVYTLSSGGTSTPGPHGVAHVYFHNLITRAGLEGRACRPNELYADAMSILVHGEGIVGKTNYWGQCEVITSAVSTEALAVVRGAVAGNIPSWFDDTYDDTNGDPELERVWAEVKAIPDWAYEDRMAAVFQLRNSFGGYCSSTKATESAVGERVSRNPWKDGGCVPGASRNVSVTTNNNLWMTVSWEPPVDDGGSPVEGYRIQWKSGGQEYDPSRQKVYTDVVSDYNRPFPVMQARIRGATYLESHTIQLIAYNGNGDGAVTETMATPEKQDGTDDKAPQLLRAELYHRESKVRLIYNEKLDGSSDPSRTAFAVYVNGVETRREGLQSIVWSWANRDNWVSLSFSAPGGVKPGE